MIHALFAATALTLAAPASGTLPAGHPPVRPGEAPPTSAELLKQLDALKGSKLKGNPSFSAAAGAGKLYYGNGRFKDSVGYFRQALEKTKPLHDFFLAEENKASGKVLDPDSVGCHSSSDADTKKLEQKARRFAKEGKHAAAAGCARAALAPALEVRALMGNALFLIGDSAGALKAHREVLQVAPKDPESLYDEAGVLFDSAGDDLGKLHQAEAGFKKYLMLYSTGSHAHSAQALLAQTEKAIAAGGLSKLPHPKTTGKLPPASAPPMVAQSAGGSARGPMMGGGGQSAGPMMGGGNGAAPALTQAQIDAIRNTKRTPELMKGLAQLMDKGEQALANEKWQDALDDYKRVVPFDPRSGRAKAGMAWALVGMGNPMGNRVWQVAVSADPAAVDHLGDTLKAKGDADGAKALWTKLAQTAPSYAAKSGLKKKL